MYQELINLIITDNFVAKLIDLLYNLKNKSGVDKISKSICILNKKDKNDVEPLVDLEIEGYHVQQVILDFGSHEDIMTRDTWEQLRKPLLNESGIYLNLVDRAIIEPIGFWKNVDTTINNITKKFKIVIINPKE